MTHGSKHADRDFAVEGLARVEGEGSLHVHVADGLVTDIGLTIFEPPRFFEAMLVGRSCLEAPDITSRICGICPVAYQLSACAAIEDACKTTIEPRIQALRRLLYCGEWIQSHALHVYLLHAPDFFDCADAVELAELDRGAVERGLRLKKVGNLIMEVIGGRAIHPVNTKVGGFYRAPLRSEIRALIEPLKKARDDALTTVEWVANFDFPDVTGDYRFVSLQIPDGYPIDSGRVVSSFGFDVTPGQYDAFVIESQVERSTALHARIDDKPYLTGPLARYALNADRLPAIAREAARAAGLGGVCTNPFKSVVVRAVELVFACDEALRLIDEYEPPEPASAVIVPQAAVGYGATEAPRGLLLHRYEIAPDGAIVSARIVPPTSQNQLTIEEDLKRVVEDGLDLSDAALTSRCEQAVRNHDPCISCAAHFLDLSMERT
jgi:coenzyme F420-reducing hydrogenase alpha subunit